MDNKLDLDELFYNETDTFTVNIVENRFALNQGKDYFAQYKGKDNYISDNKEINKYFKMILDWTSKKIPNLLKLIPNLLNKGNIVAALPELIINLSKIFCAEEHTAVSIKEIDPIIIEERNIFIRSIEHLITINKNNPYQPVIIIILKDNNFNRAKKLISGCPNNTCVKFIRNDGDATIYRVVNTGAKDIDDFIDAFSRQSFSTCSSTKKEILYGDSTSEWNDNEIINDVMPLLLKVRSCFLNDKKDKEVKEDINTLINKIENLKNTVLTNYDKELLLNLECMVLLSNIYCIDNGNDIIKAETIANNVNNDILKAHVYRFSHYKNISLQDKIENYKKAENIFRDNRIYDHASYCSNNRLILSFYTDYINPLDFDELLKSSKINTPGLVGMSILASNAGTAHLYKNNYQEAIDIYNNNKQYAKYQDSQRYGIEVNRFVALSLSGCKIDIDIIKNIVDAILINFCNKLPFIAANLLMNLIGILIRQGNSDVAKEILNYKTVLNILNLSLVNNQLGSGSLCRQIRVLNDKSGNIFDCLNLNLPAHTSSLSGIRKRFIDIYGMNPTIHNAWL